MLIYSYNMFILGDFQCLLQSAFVHIHFAIHTCIVLAPVIKIVTSDIFQTGSN